MNYTVDRLDYEGIRQNLITFLQNQKDSKGNLVYQDYNFSASGISTLINLLAYHGHYIGYYIKMLLNESFIDSAVLRESLMSKAKLTGYVPRGMRSARADITLSVNVDLNNQPSSKKILIPRGTSFTGANTNQDQRVFYTIDDSYVESVTYNTPGIATYTSSNIVVYEGKLSEWKFKVDTSLHNQRYIINDKSIDIDTIRITVSNQGSSVAESYKLSKSVLSVDSSTPVYYISTNEDGLYEIIFGNGIFSKAPENQSNITVKYISTSGESGNGCKRLIFNTPSQDIPTENNIGNWEDFIVTMNSGSSAGGVSEESIESIRFGIPNHVRRQERLVTSDDYKTILLSEFRNIDSINVWGGEENTIKDYGKIYISIKPKNTNKLTTSAKRDIKDRILKKYSVTGVEPVFVDPEFIDVDITVYSKLDLSKTNQSVGEVDRSINAVINEYNSNRLNVFDNFFSDSQLMSEILKNPVVKSCYSKQKIRKKITFLYDSSVMSVLLFGNPINTGVVSESFTYGFNTCYLKEIDSNLFIMREGYDKPFIQKPIGSVDTEKGVVRMIFPQYARVGDSKTAFGELEFIATPVNPDIFSFENNIVRISKVTTVTK